MTPAFRRAAMRTILMFHDKLWGTKVTRQCSQTSTFSEEKGEPKRNRAEALPLTNLPLTNLYNALLLGQTGSGAEGSEYFLDVCTAS